MTKKDYELIAGTIKEFNYRLSNWFNSQERKQRQEIHEELAHGMANALESDNPRFDRNKFLQACGIETEDCEFEHKQPHEWFCTTHKVLKVAGTQEPVTCQ